MRSEGTLGLIFPGSGGCGGGPAGWALCQKVRKICDRDLDWFNIPNQRPRYVVDEPLLRIQAIIVVERIGKKLCLVEVLET